VCSDTKALLPIHSFQQPLFQTISITNRVHGTIDIVFRFLYTNLCNYGAEGR